jgi:hypothetical protein
MDYEQKYYDLLYENRILKNKVKILEESLKITEKGDLKRYLINQILKYRGVI